MAANNIETCTQQSVNQADESDILQLLSIISFNMHGFNQGSHVIQDLINSMSPDIILCQEHWLTPANLNYFPNKFPEYIGFGSSAMEKCIESGPLRGRPYGGVMTLVKQNLAKFVQLIYSSDRFVILRIRDYIVINLYLPCTGTIDRLLIIEDVLHEVDLQCENMLHSCTFLVGGDFNTDLDVSDPASELIKNYMARYNLLRCYECCDKPKQNTYINDSLGHYSCLDYLLISDKTKLVDYDIVEPEVNLSDHLPISAKFLCSIKTRQNTASTSSPTVTQLRWDRADLLSYYNLTGGYLQEILLEVNVIVDSVIDASNDSSVSSVSVQLNNIYDKTVCILQHCANMCVPKRRKNFYKFWWNQELDLLKGESIKSYKNWQSAGRPRSGVIFNKFRADKLAYKLAIRENQKREKCTYTNDLHDALSNKEGQTFWNCWRSKFSSARQQPHQVDGFADEADIAENFAEYFRKTCSPQTAEGNAKLQDIYEKKRSAYVGSTVSEDMTFDASLLDCIINKMKRGKAAGLDGLTAEHLQFCHPCLPTLLAKLFNCMMHYGKVPDQFGLSYTIPLLKGNLSKHATANDFRGISISPVLSKTFELCILERYSKFLATSQNQFGFKKLSSCSHVIYTVRQVIDSFTDAGNTVNLCALDMSKAYDKMNHFGLYVKLMDRLVPSELLNILEHWFSICQTCVKWGASVSRFVTLICGVRQGGVLSPHLFSIYVDDIVRRIANSRADCKFKFQCISIFMYADDILLLSPSVTLLQKLIKVVEDELSFLDMIINAKKSMCLRIGSRFNANCANIYLKSGNVIPWVTRCRYLGVHIVSARTFKCNFDDAKRSLYRSFNAIYGKIGRCASEEVICYLIKTKCLPVLESRQCRRQKVV